MTRVIHLTRVVLPTHDGDPDAFPFALPVIRALPDLRFDAPVTMFVGENGSGKSTVLEALAIAARAITAGSAEATEDPTLLGVRALARRLRLSWAKRTHRGFYLRAEDFFGYAKRIAELRAGLERELAEAEVRHAGASDYARALALSPYRKELGSLRARYGDGLDAQSHGESFLRFFAERFVPGGVYFLDEPEAPLSPTRQLAFLSLVKEMVERDAQLIVATHSPILLSFPGAAIWSFDSDPIRRVEYDELEHVTLTRDFLRDPAAFLRHL
jgi:predicted ATPase